MKNNHYFQINEKIPCYKILIKKNGEKAKVFTRLQQDVEEEFPEICKEWEKVQKQKNEEKEDQNKGKAKEKRKEIEQSHIDQEPEKSNKKTKVEADDNHLIKQIDELKVQIENLKKNAEEKESNYLIDNLTTQNEIMELRNQLELEKVASKEWEKKYNDFNTLICSVFGPEVTSPLAQIHKAMGAFLALRDHLNGIIMEPFQSNSQESMIQNFFMNEQQQNQQQQQQLNFQGQVQHSQTSDTVPFSFPLGGVTIM